MMPAQFGSAKIGGIQYGGVTIGEAMIDGQVVYRSVITVTPQAPTFLTASPWVTLPTVTGVTYSVSGTPGKGATVTVIAAAQSGYELAGTTQWTHSWPYYPQDGGWSGTVLTFSYPTVASHTIAESGIYTISHTITGSRSVIAAIRGPWGSTTGRSGSTTSTATRSSQSLQPGNLIEFMGNGYSSTSYVGTWSIVKN